LRDRPGDSKEKESGFDHEVRLRADANGHFVFKAAVNGRLADFVADTGATYVVITYDDAERLGLSPHTLDFSAPVQTANGVTRVAPVTLTVCVWTTSRSATCPPPWPKKGALATNLLGMSFLRQLKSFHIEGNELVLIQWAQVAAMVR